jgi:Elongation factor P, C-terminal
MVELGPPATIERVASGNSRPKTVRACALLDHGKPMLLCSKHIHCTNTATVTNELKPATTETGLVVHVPAFIAVGEAVWVDTETGQSVSRAKE